MKKALIIIDLQTGFFDPKNSWYVPGIEQIFPVIKNLSEKWPASDRLFTRFVNNNLRAPEDKSSKFVPESEEASLYKSLRPLAPSQNVFEKNGYSIFKNKELLDRTKQADAIYLCGVKAEACVLFSIAEAHDLKLPVHIIMDAVTGFGVFKNKEGYKKYISYHFGRRMIDSQKLLDSLR